MSQAVGSYATEGTQYGNDASYYLLDTVPGPGAVLAGPITITGNLTTTGTTLSQGPLGAPSVATSAVTSTGNLAITSGTGNIAVTAVAGGVTVTASAAGEAKLVSGPNSVSARQAGVSMVTNGGSFSVLDADGPVATPTLTCPAYFNTNLSTSATTRTDPTAIVTTPAQFNRLLIGPTGSATQVEIPVTPLFANGCVPAFVKLTMSNVEFGSIFTGACSVSQPFTLYFYQGTSTSWDVISSQSIASFVYTNQIGTINVVGSYVTLPTITFPPILGSQISATGGPIQVWYYSYFQGFFGRAGNTQATFRLSVAL